MSSSSQAPSLYSEAEWEDMPQLEPVSADELEGDRSFRELFEVSLGVLGDAFAERIRATLTGCHPFPGDDDRQGSASNPGASRFTVTRQTPGLY
jgi:hypothetical protein